MLNYEKLHKTDYHENVVCALDLNVVEDKIIVDLYFSGNSLHSSAISMNLISNVLIKATGNSNQYEIHARNAPIKRDKTVVTRSDLDTYLFFMPLGN